MSTMDLAPLSSVDIQMAADMERSRFAPVMKIEFALERREVIKQAFSKLMNDGEDYGKVAGIGKPTLLQPGAQKLDNLFGLVPRFPVELMRIEEDWTGERHGGEPFFRYMVVCQLMRGEFVMGEAIGECNSWESKYRYRKSDRKCPTCEVEAILFTKKKSFWCAPFKGGCGAGFSGNDERLTSQETGRKANPEIFDQINTLLKMAQKRAHVGATINATSASEFFTQDVEDTREAEAIDTGVEKPGTQAAADAVAARKIAENGIPESEIPEELRFVFQNIDADTRHVAEAFKMAEKELVDRGGANGVNEYTRIIKAFRDKFPRVDGKPTETKTDLKRCLIELHHAAQAVKRREGFLATDADLPAEFMKRD